MLRPAVRFVRCRSLIGKFRLLRLLRLTTAATPALSACVAIGLAGACGAGHVPEAAETADATTVDAPIDVSPFPAYYGPPPIDAGPRTDHETERRCSFQRRARHLRTAHDQDGRITRGRRKCLGR